MKTEEISAVKDVLSVPKKIVIIPHRNPDGDAIGSTLGLMHYLKQHKHEVTVVADKPIRSCPYRVNPNKLQVIRNEVEGMLKSGIIEPSMSNWSSPVVLVPKPDGSQRFCIDYRKLNAVTVADSFPIPRIETC